MSIATAEELIHKLGLLRHPEGGWYRETYRSTEMITGDALPKRFSGSRSICTSIYFLLQKGEISAFHRIKSDELWHFHTGTALKVHMLSPEGEYRNLLLGNDLAAGTSFHGVVPAGYWFGAEVTGGGDYAFVGCTVAPGFDFKDFELASRASLQQQFPQHNDFIQRLTHETT